MQVPPVEYDVCWAQRPADMLAYPCSHNPVTTYSSSPHSLQTSLPHISFPSFHTIGRASNIVTFVTVTVMLIRTYLYVTRRRAGRVGPAPAPPLLKFCALHGAIQFVSFAMTMYLTPFHATWIPSLLRAIILLFAAQGRHLSGSQYLYDVYMLRFYDTHRHEIDTYIFSLRQKWDEVNEALQHVAVFLLKRLAVGGLPALFNFPAAQNYLIGGAKPPEEHSEPPSAETALETVEPQLPRETTVFPTARPFFAGEANDRAKAIASISSDNLNGAIQVAPVEPPKPAFEDARAMRRLFRQRAAALSRSAKVPP